MNLKIYAIRDIQANRAITPIFRENDNVAIRDFCRAIQQEPFNQAPEDYTLYRIGEWDDETMILVERENFRIMNGSEVQQKTEDIQQQIAALENQIHALQNGYETLDGLSVGGTK